MDKITFMKKHLTGNAFTLFYRTDGKGNASANTGFTTLNRVNLGIRFRTRFRFANTYDVNIDNINNRRLVVPINDDGTVAEEWTQVPLTVQSYYNSLNPTNRKLYAVDSKVNDQQDWYLLTVCLLIFRKR